MMAEMERQVEIEEYFNFLQQKDFPCIAAKAALAKEQIKCMVASHIACPKDDYSILKFMYEAVDEYRNTENFYYSAVVIFKEPLYADEAAFDKLLWQRLQALADLDAANYSYDKRVSADPSSPDFSFSIKEEAFYVIGLHPASSRTARRFKYAAIVFNPHQQFQEMKETSKYEMIKQSVRKRDIQYSGSLNPMLTDFGESSEVFQYSGMKYDDTWQCPLKINHAK